VRLEHILSGEMEICLCPADRIETSRQRYETENNSKSSDH